jgi:5'(3')-deoxyribonucleotidase
MDAKDGIVRFHKEQPPMEKKKLMIDMDGVIANFRGAVEKGSSEETLGFYYNLEPLPESIEAIKKLAEVFDAFILSTPSWSKPHSWSEKRLWIEKQFGELFFKKIILTHRKDLVMGDFLIDDHTWNGADKFCGELIHFGSDKFPSWQLVLDYLLPKAEKEKPEFIYTNIGAPQTGKTNELKKKGQGLGALFPHIIVPKDEQTHNQSQNTMATEKPYEQVLKELKENIAVQLDLCEPISTPTVCTMKATPEGYKKLEDMMIELIADGGKTISQAIIDVERAFNPNMIQD